MYGYKFKEEKFRLMEEILYWGGSETLELVAQGGSGCPNPEGVQSQVGLDIGTTWES